MHKFFYGPSSIIDNTKNGQQQIQVQLYSGRRRRKRKAGKYTIQYKQVNEAHRFTTLSIHTADPSLYELIFLFFFLMFNGVFVTGQFGKEFKVNCFSFRMGFEKATSGSRTVTKWFIENKNICWRKKNWSEGNLWRKRSFFEMFLLDLEFWWSKLG